MFWPLALAIAAIAGRRLAVSSVRDGLQHAVRTLMLRLQNDPYPENLWEMVSATRRPGPQTILENGLRAEHGALLHRPLGSPRRWPNLEALVFDGAQLARRPAVHDVPVDMAVTLGPRAKRPLKVDIPILVSGMAYGLALSRRAKVALARGAALAGTASNSGEGPVLPLEWQANPKLIVQYPRARWGGDPVALRHAAMVEVHLGQGASTGVGGEVVGARSNRRLRRELGVGPGEPAVIYSHHDALKTRSLRELVDELRSETDGVPIGVKLAPGRRLEQDLEACLAAGVDYIALDGAQAATKGSPPILQDDFGLPTLYALVRAVRFLEASGAREQVSLIVGGGLYTPGDYLKVLALGADAVYIGTVALFAVSHGQVFKAMPWEPPTQLVFFGGHQEHELDVDEGAYRLANYLRAAAWEMAVAVRALGKTAVRDVSKEDLMALDELTARLCDVPVAHHAPAPRHREASSPLGIPAGT
ncbi:MAG: hypothetical protein BAA04_07870 [Firmicutes bacterium ZCTH02-B6]|nr:MAG: hypothetical protein BAA04_07870 [Firmicutes bacterium ZCTH02-B6]